MTTIVSKTESVMEVSVVDTHHACFNNQDPDGPPADRAVTIPRSLWVDMGYPPQITVTIVPGDTLNAAPDDASGLLGGGA